MLVRNSSFYYDNDTQALKCVYGLCKSYQFAPGSLDKLPDDALHYFAHRDYDWVGIVETLLYNRDEEGDAMVSFVVLLLEHNTDPSLHRNLYWSAPTFDPWEDDEGSEDELVFE